ncbi:MAG TPA: tripartite tricarboxylate transporter TctB family protein [bacterium]|nr:tripartite tricarboxylate transporter TctB family protein [bacterium]
MRRWDRLTGGLVLAFAVYTMSTAVRLGYWQGRIPGPGFAPIWIGAGLALCALLLLVRRPPAAPRAPARSADERIAARRELILAIEIASAAVAVMLLIPRVGMLAGLALLLLALVKLLGGSWRSAVGTGVVVPLAFYLMFVRWLAVPIPVGPWGF